MRKLISDITNGTIDISLLYAILRTDIVMDLGESLNPAIDIGQVEGGFMQVMKMTAIKMMTIMILMMLTITSGKWIQALYSSSYLSSGLAF